MHYFFFFFFYLFSLLGGFGAVYVRWGREDCPGNGANVVYKGKVIVRDCVSEFLVSSVYTSDFSSYPG